MRFVKAYAVMLEIDVEVREGNTDVANKVCLGSDLEEKRGNISTPVKLKMLGN
jgi:hypothetical protein